MNVSIEIFRHFKGNDAMVNEMQLYFVECFWNNFVVRPMPTPENEEFSVI